MLSVLLLLVQFCIALFIITSILYYLDLYRWKSKFKDVYMPFHVPFLGLGYAFINRSLMESMDELYRKSPYRKMISKVGTNKIYVTTDPEEVKCFLNHPNCLNKSDTYKFCECLFKNTLILAPFQIWKPNRRSLSKCFNSNLLESFVPIIYDKSEILLEKLKGNDVDLLDCMERFAFDSFCVTGLGMDFNAQVQEARFVHLLSEVQELAGTRLYRPWEQVDFVYFKTKRGRKLMELKREIEAEIGKVCENVQMIIEEKQQLHTKINETETIHKSVIEAMLDLQESGHFNNQQLLQETFLFLAAAVDTSGVAMAYTCGFLGMHQDVQQKLYQEIMEVVGPSRAITKEDLPKLKYTERVINESMRLLPPVPIFGRMTNSPIKIGENTIEPGTDIVIFTYGIHRDERHFPDPLKFDPDRFLPEELAKRPSSSFIPFSTGPRNCIGLKYAQIVMKVNIANVIRQFKIETEQKTLEDIKINVGMVIKSPNLKCYFRKRQ